MSRLCLGATLCLCRRFPLPIPHYQGHGSLITPLPLSLTKKPQTALTVSAVLVKGRSKGYYSLNIILDSKGYFPIQYGLYTSLKTSRKFRTGCHEVLQYMQCCFA